MQVMVCIGNYNGFHVQLLFQNDNESTDKTVNEIKTDAVLEAGALFRAF